jgi:hypothetical protein
MRDPPGEANHRPGRGVKRLVSVQDPRRSLHDEDMLVLFLVKVNRSAVTRT